jgi:hypothetical protein
MWRNNGAAKLKEYGYYAVFTTEIAELLCKNL